MVRISQFLSVRSVSVVPFGSRSQILIDATSVVPG